MTHSIYLLQRKQAKDRYAEITNEKRYGKQIEREAEGAEGPREMRMGRAEVG